MRLKIYISDTYKQRECIGNHVEFIVKLVSFLFVKQIDDLEKLS